MTGEKFAEIVTKRANERVQEKLKQFKQAIKHAFYELTGSDYVWKNETGNKSTEANNKILENMAKEYCLDPNRGWPKYLWEKEEEKVKDELLSLMDEMQKALLSPGTKADDCKQEQAVMEVKAKPYDAEV